MRVILRRGEPIEFLVYDEDGDGDQYGFGWIWSDGAPEFALRQRLHFFASGAGPAERSLAVEFGVE